MWDARCVRMGEHAREAGDLPLNRCMEGRGRRGKALHKPCHWLLTAICKTSHTENFPHLDVFVVSEADAADVSDPVH